MQRVMVACGKTQAIIGLQENACNGLKSAVVYGILLGNKRNIINANTTGAMTLIKAEVDIVN